MLKIIKKFFLSFIFLWGIISCVTAFADKITNYHPIFIPGYDTSGNLKIAIRTYQLNNKPYFLVVNPYTFKTEIIPIANLVQRFAQESSNFFVNPELLKTPYIKTLLQSTASPYPLTNDGITHANYSAKGFFLTIDMCPSSKTFETEFFNALISKSEREQHALPISIAISGLWMIEHPKEFAWLIQQENANKLQITWINHSFNHFYYAGLPLKENFLLAPQTNFENEILATEKVLLEHQQIPSVFFRFPGLVSSKHLILELRQFGLIPIGSDAWLAKDQPAQNGSIVLVHGNSNEPEGIKKIMPLLKQSDLQFLPINKVEIFNK